MKSRAVAIAAVILLTISAVAMTSCDDLGDPTTTFGSTTTEGSATTISEESSESTPASAGPAPNTAVLMVTVPNVGFPNGPDEATAALEAVGLVASLDYTSSTGSMDYGKVVWQDPEPGTVVAVGSTVVITVHGTGEKAQVPNVIGMAQFNAENAIFAEYLHCQVIIGTGRHTPGVVYDQNPAAGTLLDEGDSVTIYVGS